MGQPTGRRFAEADTGSGRRRRWRPVSRAVPSGRRVTASPPFVTKSNISLDTTSVLAPMAPVNTPRGSTIGVCHSWNPNRRAVAQNADLTPAACPISSPYMSRMPRTGRTRAADAERLRAPAVRQARPAARSIIARRAGTTAPEQPTVVPEPREWCGVVRARGRQRGQGAAHSCWRPGAPEPAPSERGPIETSRGAAAARLPRWSARGRALRGAPSLALRLRVPRGP